jgi:hypothetical protein
VVVVERYIQEEPEFRVQEEARARIKSGPGFRKIKNGQDA